MDRRTFLTATGVTATSLTLAGCLDGIGADEQAAGNQDSEGTQSGNRTADRDQQITDIESEQVTIQTPPAALRVTSFEAFESGNNIGVTGVVQNVGQQPISNIRAAVTLRDGDTTIGKFTDYSQENRDLLRPENSWRFYMNIDDMKTTSQVSFTLVVTAKGRQGGTDTPSGTFGTENSTETAGQTDTGA